jgi:hypothetical protein
MSNALIREFDYSGLISEDCFLNPSSGNYMLAADMMPAWHATGGCTNGQVSIYGGNHLKPVIWSHTQVIYDDTPSGKTFRAPVMYFVDVGICQASCRYPQKFAL